MSTRGSLLWKEMKFRDIFEQAVLMAQMIIESQSLEVTVC